MNSRVKHWIAGVSVLVVIITCVVLFAVFGDTAMPGQSNLVLNESYVMTSFALSGEESEAPSLDDLELVDGMSKHQSVLYYRNYLYKSNFKFNKDNRLSVATAGRSENSVYDYSQAASKINLKDTASTTGDMDFSKTDMRIKDGRVTVEYSVYGYVGSATFQLVSSFEKAPAIGGKQYLFNSYSITADPTSANASAKALRDVQMRSMNVNLQNSWLVFQKSANGKSYVHFTNGNVDTANDWEYTLNGNTVSLIEKEQADNTIDTGVQIMGSVEMNGDSSKITIRNLGADYEETIVFVENAYREMSNGITAASLVGTLNMVPSSYVGQGTADPVYGKVTWTFGMGTTNKTDAIKNWHERGILPPNIYVAGDTADNNIARMEAYVRSTVFTTGAIPESVVFSRGSTGNATKPYNAEVTLSDKVTGGASLGNSRFMAVINNNTQGLWHLYVQGSGIPSYGYTNDLENRHQITMDFIGVSKATGTSPTEFSLAIPTFFDEYLKLTFEYKLTAA